MRKFIPGTRAFREFIRLWSREDDGKTSDPVGLYSLGSAGQRRALVAIGGANAGIPNARPFREALQTVWFLASGVWNDEGLWQDAEPW
jgi:hypothetical protein